MRTWHSTSTIITGVGSIYVQGQEDQNRSSAVMKKTPLGSKGVRTGVSSPVHEPKQKLVDFKGRPPKNGGGGG